MPRDSKPAATTRGPRLWLQTAGIILLIANAAALYFYISPPGGSRSELLEQSQGIRNQIATLKANTNRVKLMASKVQTGSQQDAEFEKKYILPRRQAYGAVISEVLRMAKASGLQEREAGYSEEPIEGSSDLSLLNLTGNFEGSYQSLMKFLNEADHSPMMLILDTLQASPLQHSGDVNASVRFQAIVRDDTSPAGGQQ